MKLLIASCFLTSTLVLAAQNANAIANVACGATVQLWTQGEGFPNTKAPLKAIALTSHPGAKNYLVGDYDDRSIDIDLTGSEIKITVRNDLDSVAAKGGLSSVGIGPELRIQYRNPKGSKYENTSLVVSCDQASR